MAIGQCQEGQRSSIFSNFSSDEEALEALHRTDPHAPEDALCKSSGDSYRVILEKTDITKPPSSSDDPKNNLIFQILDKQNSILTAQMDLDGDRAELANAYKTRSQLKDAKALKQTPTEKLLYSALSMAVSFGVVTGLFKDGATAAYLGYLAVRGEGGLASNLVYRFERYSEMRRLAMEAELCGPLQMPGEPSEYGSLWKSLAVPLLLGAAVAVGAVLLSKAFQGGGGKETTAAAPGASSRSASNPLSYKNEELQQMDLGKLRVVDADLTARLGQPSEERQKIFQEARGVYRDIYGLYLGELKSRDLDEIKDEELRAKAQEIIAKGAGEPDPSFLEKLGTMEYVGIGVGFGVGTGILHRWYNGVSPWRDFIDRRMYNIGKQARQDAARRIEELKTKGVLSKCSEENAVEEKPQETAATNDNTVPEEDQAPQVMMNSIQPDYEGAEQEYIDHPEWAGPAAKDNIISLLVVATLLLGPEILLAAPEAAAVGGTAATVEATATTGTVAGTALTTAPEWLTVGVTVANDVLPWAAAGGIGSLAIGSLISGSNDDPAAQ